MPSTRRGDSADPQDSAGPSRAEVQDQLDRILASAPFRKSLRLKRFLKLTVERALAGDAAQLKEYTLGREAFDRGPKFDPRLDPIVRVEATRLRSKLREYYETYGASDPVRIGFPRGAYVPVFARAAPDPPPAARQTPDPRTVAVLPFSNLSPEPEQDFFSEGITEDIIDRITTIPELSVVGRASSFVFKSSRADAREIGARLGAGTLVEGSVRKAGDVLRVSARIIQADSQRALWSEVFDRRVGDVFSIEDEIAGAIAGALHVKLAVGQSGSPRDSAPTIEAYALYLKGRRAWNLMSPQGFRDAVELFDRAISLFPDYAPPYAGLADTLYYLAAWGLMSPFENGPKVKRAAQESLRLDPNLAHAYTSLGLAVSFFDLQWQEGLALLRKAIEMEPSYSLGQQQYGTILLLLGHFEEALRACERAVRLDPLAVRTNRSLGWVYFVDHRPVDAEKWIREAIDLDPESLETRCLLAQVYMEQRRFEEALAVMQVPHSEATGGALGVLGACLARAGSRDRALRILERLSSPAPGEYSDPLAAAYVHHALGDFDRTLDCIEQAVEIRSPFLWLLLRNPLFEDLRPFPRFHRLVETLNFA